MERAEADLAQKEALARTARDRASRDTRLQRAAPGALSAEAYRQAQDALLSAEADVEVAKAALNQARLDQAFTRVVAPVDGYVVNLALQPGTMAVAYQPVLALISADSFRIEAFFRETQIGHFRPGDKALVTLMSYPGLPLNATVESIGWGIARQNGSTGEDLLPVVSPTFEWIRLAQRIPVRVRLDEVPEGVELRMGTTASVLVRVDPRDKQGTSSLCLRWRSRGGRSLGEGEGKLSKESFPSPNPSPFPSKTFDWWGGCPEGVRSDGMGKDVLRISGDKEKKEACKSVVMKKKERPAVTGQKERLVFDVSRRRAFPFASGGAGGNSTRRAAKPCP